MNNYSIIIDNYFLNYNHRMKVALLVLVLCGGKKIQIFTFYFYLNLYNAFFKKLLSINLLNKQKNRIKRVSVFLVYPSFYLFSHSSTHSFIHLLPYPSTHPFIHPPIHLSIHPFIHLSIHPPIYSTIHSFIHLSQRILLIVFSHACKALSNVVVSMSTILFQCFSY